jgi:DNA-binding response OmpR family regulator
MSALLTPEEARALSIAPRIRKLLGPADVAGIGVIPLAEDAAGDTLVVASDPAAVANLERLIRMRLGVRRVDVRPATREAMLALIETHYRPDWQERGWEFPGFAPLAAPARPEPPVEPPPPVVVAPAAPPPRQEARAAGAGEHPQVLFLETEEKWRRLVGDLFMESGFEPRFVGSVDEVVREIQRSPPSAVVTRGDGPVSPEVLHSVLRKQPRAIELRILRGYAQALVEEEGDERLPVFLFDLVRFFTSLIAAESGPAIQGTEGRARTAERAARRMGLKRRDVEAARLAVFFADLEGRLSLRGGAAPGVEKEGDAGSADPLRQLLDPDRTPYPIRSTLEMLGEHCDGSGPKGLAGEAIPPAARVLAAVDSFFELKGQGVLGEELDTRLRAEAGKRLDPRAVEAVLRAERAERLVDHLGSEGERVVIVDPDPVASSLLQMRLANAGFQVEVHRDGEKALASIQGRVPDLILSEIALPAVDGFSLLLRLRKAEPTREVPFVFVSERKDRGSSMRGFDLGADDFVQKPADLELLVAKAKGMIRKARSRRPAGNVEAGGVSGNLSEMGIVDLLQVLSASRRTVRVKVEDGKGQSGELSLLNGRPVDARRGDVVGDDALYELIDWSEGRFTVQTAEPPGEQTITATLEGLLIEACRRRDEAQRGA